MTAIEKKIYKHGERKPVCTGRTVRTYGVVADVARGRAQVNDGPGGRTTRGVRVHVSHDVVSGELLLVGGRQEVNVVDVAAKFLQLFVGYVQTQLLET